MKKRRPFLPVIALGLMLTACGNPGKDTGTAPGSTGADTSQENPEAENLPASQEYVVE